ncbi:MAG: hypothetical protein EZS28_012126 [Streblomastix strix]|uniref:Uncharacterized protein n=1 Tax=Streblomastix strix TaxID=222440 RepID=A0A5J4WBN0_9EUKA|nr:MAG: hypothetical protein EZS28_012126 [Streblomastix strix]
MHILRYQPQYQFNKNLYLGSTARQPSIEQNPEGIDTITLLGVLRSSSRSSDLTDHPFFCKPLSVIQFLALSSLTNAFTLLISFANLPTKVNKAGPAQPANILAYAYHCTANPLYLFKISSKFALVLGFQGLRGALVGIYDELELELELELDDEGCYNKKFLEEISSDPDIDSLLSSRAIQTIVEVKSPFEKDPQPIQISSRRRSSIFEETITSDPTVCKWLLDIISDDEHIVKESAHFILSQPQLIRVVAYTYEVPESQVEIIAEDETCCSKFCHDGTETITDIAISNVNILTLDVDKVNLLRGSYKICLQNIRKISSILDLGEIPSRIMRAVSSGLISVLSKV